MASIFYCPHCGTPITTLGNWETKCPSCGWYISSSIKENGTITIRIWEETRQFGHPDQSDWDVPRRLRDKKPRYFDPEIRKEIREIKLHTSSTSSRTIDWPAQRLPRIDPAQYHPARPIRRMDERKLILSEVSRRPSTPLENGISAFLTGMVILGLIIVAVASTANFQWSSESIAAAVIFTVIASAIFSLFVATPTKPVDAGKSDDQKKTQNRNEE